MINPEILFEIAWTSINKKVIHDEEWLPELNEMWLKQKQGVFVTAYMVEDGKRELRGCIGLPYPDKSLGHAVALSAFRTVSEDPRFPPVKKEELDHMVISLEILSPIEEIKYHSLEDLKNNFEIGVHGLILQKKSFAGLLLPQVPVEYNWTKDEYLSNLAKKAFLSDDVFMSSEARLFRFSSTFFKPRTAFHGKNMI